MSYPYRVRRRPAFTMLELLNVIIIIAILALIVIPRVFAMSRRSREARMRSDLVQLRRSIELFQSDTGVYPLTLQDLVAPDKDALSAGLPVEVINAYRGPYIVTPQEGIHLVGYPGLPANPFVSASDTDVSHHWHYDSDTGILQTATEGTTYDGIAYAEL